MVADRQRLAVRGRVLDADDPELQWRLAQVHGTGERPRCLCRPGGVEMYVARYGTYLAKRLPETGHLHHPSCPSYEPEACHSGLGTLLGTAVREHEPGRVEVRVDFAWTRVGARGVRQDAVAPSRCGREIDATPQRLGLGGLTHLLFDRAGFNRWSPAMDGKRNQGVLRKYLMEAAGELEVKGRPLADRLFVPEPYSAASQAAAAQRRRDKLSVLQPLKGAHPLAMVLGEFKAAEEVAGGHRIWIRHLPDAPLWVEAAAWTRIRRAFKAVMEAREADGGRRARIVMTAMIRARHEGYEIDSASLMLASEHWIPVDGIDELLLVQALVAQERRFVKPLRYESASAAIYPNVLLLDAGPWPVALHRISASMKPAERAAKEAVIAAGGLWCWRAGEAMPELPTIAPRPGSAAPGRS